MSRTALVPTAGAALCSVANIVEDGLRQGWAFYAFVLGTSILNLGLLALTVVTALVAHGGRRLLALIPAATLAGILFYVPAGGGAEDQVSWE